MIKLEKQYATTHHDQLSLQLNMLTRDQPQAKADLAQLNNPAMNITFTPNTNNRLHLSIHYLGDLNYNQHMSVNFTP